MTSFDQMLSAQSCLIRLIVLSPPTEKCFTAYHVRSPVPVFFLQYPAHHLFALSQCIHFSIVKEIDPILISNFHQFSTKGIVNLFVKGYPATELMEIAYENGINF